jgi:hypothetical protein
MQCLAWYTHPTTNANQHSGPDTCAPAQHLPLRLCREQYRISGTLAAVGADHEDQKLAAARQAGQWDHDSNHHAGMSMSV